MRAKSLLSSLLPASFQPQIIPSSRSNVQPSHGTDLASQQQGSVNPNQPWPCFWNKADVPKEIPILEWQGPVPWDYSSMSGIWQQEGGRIDGIGVHPQIITWSCCTKDKMEFEYFYFYPFFLFSPPALTNALQLFSQAAGGLCDLSCPRLSCPQDMALQLGLNPHVTQNPSDTFLWVSVSVGAFSNITLVV